MGPTYLGYNSGLQAAFVNGVEPLAANFVKAEGEITETKNPDFYPRAMKIRDTLLCLQTAVNIAEDNLSRSFEA